MEVSTVSSPSHQRHHGHQHHQQARYHHHQPHYQHATVQHQAPHIQHKSGPPIPLPKCKDKHLQNQLHPMLDYATSPPHQSLHPYAGAKVFNDSPAPDALPMPSFLTSPSRPVPAGAFKSPAPYSPESSPPSDPASQFYPPQATNYVQFPHGRAPTSPSPTLEPMTGTSVACGSGACPQATQEELSQMSANLKRLLKMQSA